MTARKLFIGIGSHHGLDRLGWLVAQKIQATGLEDIDVRLAPTPYTVLDWLDDYQEVHLCDYCRVESIACQSPVVAVDYRRWPTNEYLSTRAWGTHDTSIISVLEIADQLQMIRGTIHLWAIQVASSTDDQLTEPELSALATQAARVLRAAPEFG